MDSKKLSINDTSGDLFSKNVFSNKMYKDMEISFDRIQFDYKDNNWLFIEHILIDKPVDSIEGLPIDIQSKIMRTVEFTEHFKDVSQKETKVIIDLFFDKNSSNKDTVMLMDENYKFHTMDIADYAAVFREINFNGNENNKNKNYFPKKNNNYTREDNSGFELSRVCLNGDVTYGFNLDKLFFNKNTKQIYLFELLLCDETQIVTPHTSHPNRYFQKNKSKFTSLFKLSKEMGTNLYLINYAKEGTKHEDKVKFMKVLDIDEKNLKSPLLTEDKNLNLTQLKNGLEKRIIPMQTKKIKIGL